MEFYLFDKNKKKITYNKILNLDFEKDLYIPCAGFKATLLLNDNFNIENVSKIKSFLLKIKSDVLYYGVIDTACAEFIGQSIILKLKGRDNMAYLLDSEADTTTFINAKLSDILKHYCNRFGYDAYSILDNGYYNKLIGTDNSIYDAIKSIVCDCKGTHFYTINNILCVSKPRDNAKIIQKFSNNASDNMKKFLRLAKYNKNRAISKIHLVDNKSNKVTLSSPYISNLESKRELYYRVSKIDEDQKNYAMRIMLSSARESNYFEMDVPDICPAQLLQKARVRIKESFYDFFIIGLRVLIDNGKVTTRLKLCKKENII